MRTLQIVGLAALLTGGVVEAVPYTDIINYVGANGGLPLLGVSMGGIPIITTPTVIGSFVITDSGYNTLTEQIVSATATFIFGDPLGGAESLTIDLNTTSFLSPINLANGLAITTLSGPVLGTQLDALDANGVLSYQVSRVTGQFFLRQVELRAESVPIVPVGENGTASILLGAGMLSLYGLKRRQNRV
jgi:hypothetical protein